MVELLLVMALLVIAVSFVGPKLAGFFRGRTLDSEARRLLALTHYGQERAIGEGIPMVLWIEPDQKKYGLEQQAGWEDNDPREVRLELDKDLKVEVVRQERAATNTLYTTRQSSVIGQSMNLLAQNGTQNSRPEIHFLPDGTVGQQSLRAVGITDRDGITRWLVQATNRLSYEISTNFTAQ
jgi:Tfp pilus assembly protein FimT